MTGFRKLEDIDVWIASKELVKEIYRVTATGIVRRDSAYSDQIRRAVISIGTNIAEGFGKQSDKEFARFLDIARGSALETKSLLSVGFELDYVNTEDFRRLEDTTMHIAAQLTSLSRYLRKTTAVAKSK